MPSAHGDAGGGAACGTLVRATNAAPGVAGAGATVTWSSPTAALPTGAGSAWWQPPAPWAARPSASPMIRKHRTGARTFRWGRLYVKQFVGGPARSDTASTKNMQAI